MSLHGFWLAKQCSVLPVLCILSNCAKTKLQTEKQLSLLYSLIINALDYKRNKNAVAGVSRLNLLVVKI